MFIPFEVIISFLGKYPNKSIQQHKNSIYAKVFHQLFFLFYFIYLLIYFWLCWVFVAARGLSLLAASGGCSSLRCAGFSLRWLLVAEHGL